MILDTFTFLFKPEGQEKVKEAVSGISDFFGKQADAQKVKLDNLMGAVAPLIAAYGTLRTIMSFTDDNEQLYNVNNMTGIATQSMRELGFATEQFGGGLSSAVGTLSHMQSLIQQVKTTGGGALTSAASKYGLQFSNDPEQMLRNIAKRMEGMTKSQQIDLGRMLGLDNPTIQLLQKGLKGLNEELSRAHDLNFMDEKTLEASHALVKDIREMVILFKGAAQTMTVQFHPELSGIVSAIRNGALYLMQHREVLEGIAQKALAIGKIYAGWKLAQVLTSPSGLGALAIAGGGMLHEDYKVWKRLKKTGNQKLDEDLEKNTFFGRYFGIGEKAVEQFNKDWDTIKNRTKKIVTDYVEKSEYLQGIKSIWSNVWEEIKDQNNTLLDKIEILCKGIVDTFNFSIEKVKDEIEQTELGKYLLDLMDDTIEHAEEIGWLASLTNMFSKLFKDVSDFVEKEFDKLGSKIDEMLESDDDNPIIDSFAEMFDNFVDWLENTDVYQNICEWWERLGDDIDAAINDTLGDSKHASLISSLFSFMLRDALGVQKDDTIKQHISKQVKSAMQKAKQTVDENKQGIKSTISEIIADGIAQGFSKTGTNIATWFVDNAKKAKGLITGLFSSDDSKQDNTIIPNVPEKNAEIISYIQSGNTKDMNMQTIAEITKPNQLNTTNNTTNTTNTTNNTNYFQTPISNDQFFDVTRNSSLHNAMTGGR